MGKHRIRTNYINPVVLTVFGMFPIMSQAVPQFSIFRYLRDSGYSEKFIFYFIFVAITVWLALVFLVEYYRGLKYIEVEITDEGINTNWFVTRDPSIFFNFGKRIEGLIPWEDIVRFDDLPLSGGLSWFKGFFIETKNDKRYYWIGFLYYNKAPENYNEMKADFEAHLEAYKMSREDQ
jgi:hypothetical protein